jgi:CPA1 family monovalent cation:H+ antiporter
MTSTREAPSRETRQPAHPEQSRHVGRRVLQFADEYSLDAAIDALDTTASEPGSGEMVVERARHALDKLRKLQAAAAAEDDPAIQHDHQYRSLSLAHRSAAPDAP